MRQAAVLNEARGAAGETDPPGSRVDTPCLLLRTTSGERVDESNDIREVVDARGLVEVRGGVPREPEGLRGGIRGDLR